MEFNEKEASDGIKWMFGAGAFALALTAFLVYTDNSLIDSKREQILGETLRELRTAQTSLGTGLIDERQLHLGEDSSSAHSGVSPELGSAHDSHGSAGGQ